MSENKQSSGTSDALSAGASAARSVQSAVKIGKAMAGVSKGAAVGGPYGAAAAGAWQSRHLILKAILAAAFIMLLPILFILMLPSLIFGGLRRSPSPDELPDFDFTIMDDNSAIIANIRSIDESVRGILSEAHGAIVEEIGAIIAALPEDDEYEIVDEFNAESALDVHLLISQFSAANDQNYENINLETFTALITQHKSELFSFEVTIEEREIITLVPVESEDEDDEDNNDDSDDNDEQEYVEEIVIYHVHTFTILFVGADYFANEVFQLTEEQAQLSRYFAENLALFLSTIG